MNDNPYTPPESAVKDVPYARAVEARPRNIVHAVRMLWISLVLSIPLTMREYQDAASEGNAAFLLYFILTLYAISVLINVYIHRGSHWARVLLLVFNILNVLSLLAAMRELPGYQAGDLVCLATSMALDLTALTLVYTRPGALWFRQVPRHP
jgi:hypothetical protein